MAPRPEAQPGSKRQYNYTRPTGAKAKYNPEFHINYLIEKSHSSGYMVHDYCADWGICTETFYNWVREHKEFASAYKEARCAQKQWWFNQAKRGMNQVTGETFNATAWSMCMRNMGVSTEERKLSIDIEDCTPEMGIKRVKRAISRGEITAKEGKILLEMFVAEQSLKNSTLMGNEMEAHINALEEKLKEYAGKA